MIFQLLDHLVILILYFYWELLLSYWELSRQFPELSYAPLHISFRMAVAVPLLLL